ncbi:helix-turn-helix transcriptional regulator [Bacteroidia bacterium]|nr:helix-turn-helix transcriptional regulator [Bacteroidia bacterium]
MRRTKHIGIISNDTLQSTGLQSLLVDYFAPVEIGYYTAFDCFTQANVDFDYYFTQAETFILNADFFLPRRTKTVVLSDKLPVPDDCSCRMSGKLLSNGCNIINACSTQEAIIEQLQHIFSAETASANGEKNKELSTREIDVLQLIVQGHTNKDIADRLNISLNTVLSHRKNITSKLGIKTTSGLTFYALMNGLVSSDLIS